MKQHKQKYTYPIELTDEKIKDIYFKLDWIERVSKMTIKEYVRYLFDSDFDNKDDRFGQS